MKSIAMTERQKATLTQIALEAQTNIYGWGKGKRFTVDFKKKVVKAMQREKLTGAVVSDALKVSHRTVVKWKSVYKSDDYASIAVVANKRPKAKANLSVKSLEAERLKLQSQVDKGIERIKKIDNALAVFASLDI